jgi:hypothetical protein
MSVWLLEPALVFALTTLLASILLVAIMEMLSDQRLTLLVVIFALALAIGVVASSVLRAWEG